MARFERPRTLSLMQIALNRSGETLQLRGTQVVVGSPTFISAERLCNRIAAVGTAHRSMMFESVLTDNMHQSWQFRHIDNGAGAKGAQWVVREVSLRDIGTN